MKANPYAATIYQRVSGGVNPDVDWANNMDGAPEGKEPGYLRYQWGKFLAWEQEYGLSATQRADPAVILSLYEAAQKQVADEAQRQPMTTDEQQQRIAHLAETAMYYSNQTFDRTDRSAFQLDRSLLNNLFGLYQGQGFKVFSSMALRNVEAALAPANSQQRSDAMQAWGKAVAVNVVLGSLWTATIQTLAQATRQLPAKLWDDDNDDEWLKLEGLYEQLTGSLFQNIPVVGDGLLWGVRKITKQPTFDQPFSVQLFDSILQFFDGVFGALGHANNWTSKRKLYQELAVDAKKTIRGGGEMVGVSNEATRVIANYVQDSIKPEARRKRSDKKKEEKNLFDLLVDD